MIYSNILSIIETILQSAGLKQAVNVSLSDTGTLNFDAGYVIRITKDSINTLNVNNVSECELYLTIDIGYAKAMQKYQATQIEALEKANVIRNALVNIDYNTLTQNGIDRVQVGEIQVKVNELGSVIASIEVIVYYNQY